MSKLSSVNISIQRHLFPELEEEIGKLSDNEQKFIKIVELINLHSYLASFLWCGIGRKPHSRISLAKAFVAKAVWDMPITRALLDMINSSPSLRRLCGWDTVADIPAESAFSRAFASFAEMELPQQIHAQPYHNGGELAKKISLFLKFFTADTTVSNCRAASLYHPAI